MKLRSRHRLPPARLKAPRVRTDAGRLSCAPPAVLSALSVLVGVMAAPMPADANTSTSTSSNTSTSTSTADAVATVASATAAEDIAFPTTFLRTRPNETVDVARFSRANQVAPGVYNLDILVNGRRLDRIDVRFVGAEGSGGASPCLERSMLENLGVDFSKVEAGDGAAGPSAAAAPAAPAADPTACLDIARQVPGAMVDVDFGEQSLSLSVPQKYMRRSARGYVSPERWDYGVNAGFVNYSASTYRTEVAGHSRTSGYLGLNAGANFNGWRFRNQSSLTTADGQGARYGNIATYVQHDVQALRSQATFGDAYTSGEIFDSVGFRGVQLATDDRMLPESQRGYAPVVRGTAQTNAQVLVKQNGTVIYETRVSPGPFEINDLYPSGYGGNLEVQVLEADGRSSTFVVPYAAVPQSLRPGVTRYAATAGRLRDQSLDQAPGFAQFTLQRGLTNQVTAYGGALVSEGYSAANLGGALTTRLGAFAADVTGASTQLPGGPAWRGTSYRLSYNKYFAPSDTNVALAAYRYSTPGYLGLPDAAAVRELALREADLDQVARQRGRLQVSLNQSLGDYGSVYVSASAQQYWNREQSDTFFQAGYTNGFKYGTYSITAGRTRGGDGRMANQIAVGITIPLGQGAHSPQLTSNFTRSDGASTAQASLGGALGQNNQFTYNAYGSYGRDAASGASASAGASGTYRGAYGQVSGSASSGSHTHQVSAGVSGAVVVHPGGVTLSQTVGDTFGIVHAPGAQGATISSASGVQVNAEGYAVVPYLTPYSLNTVDIDPKGTSANVEFTSTSQQAVPRDGAIALLDYETVTGRAALIQAPRANGSALPFGADVLDAQGRTVGVVAQSSRIFVRGIEDQGWLTVKWGEGAAQQCRVEYSLPAPTPESDAAYTSVQGRCTPPAASPRSLRADSGQPAPGQPQAAGPEPHTPAASHRTDREKV